MWLDALEQWIVKWWLVFVKPQIELLYQRKTVITLYYSGHERVAYTNPHESCSEK